MKSHKLNNGGPDQLAPERVTLELLKTLRGRVAYAPLHLPSEIMCLEAALKRFPERPQVACFDTAFHRRMPERAQRFPLPHALWEESVRRYGFHGLSYEYIVETLGEETRGRINIAKRASAPPAAQAVELFCYQLRKQIGALDAALGGLDKLVFTGGIGERAAPVRWEVCQDLEYLGIRLDPKRNDVHAETISDPQSNCPVWVIPTREDLMIARHT